MNKKNKQNKQNIDVACQKLKMTLVLISFWKTRTRTDQSVEVVFQNPLHCSGFFIVETYWGWSGSLSFYSIGSQALILIALSKQGPISSSYRTRCCSLPSEICLHDSDMFLQCAYNHVCLCVCLCVHSVGVYLHL